MNFFQILAEKATGVDVTLRIKEKNGTLTVMVTPEAGNKSQVKGRVITASPADLDAGFFDAITPVMEQAKAVLIQDVEAAKKEDDGEDSGKPGVIATKPAKKSSKKADKKAAKKKDAPAKKTAPAVQPASMFDQPAESPAGDPQQENVTETNAEEPAETETDSVTE